MSKSQEKMDRIRAARGLPPLRSMEQLDREQTMLRVRAARCMIDQTGMSAERARKAELHAFMDIFHPEVPSERVFEMSRNIRETT